MSITLRRAESRAQLKAFVDFPLRLYRDSPHYVPAIAFDELNTLDPVKNPAFEFCEAVYFLAERDGEVVGRIAGIINRRAIEKWGKKYARFGWIDFIEDFSVAEALLRAVEEWAAERGMEGVHGPLGFTDLDREGLLVEGFDQVATFITIYNGPWYGEYLERLGYAKDADWVEYRIRVPEEEPEKHRRIAALVQQKYGLEIRKYRSAKKIAREYGQKIFELVNEAYAPLYGYSPLSQGQIDQYVKMYLPILDLDLVTLVTDKAGELIAVGVTMPSLSRALQKAKGKMFPFGWVHLLKTLFLKHPDTLDLLIIAVKPEYQNKGVNGLLFSDLIKVYNRKGYKWAESNPELELNEAVQRQWDYFENRQHKRRRAYKKKI